MMRTPLEDVACFRAGCGGTNLFTLPCRRASADRLWCAFEAGGRLRCLLGSLEGGGECDDRRVFIHDVLVPFAICLEIRV